MKKQIKKFKRMLVETKDFRELIMAMTIAVMLIGFVYPWIAKAFDYIWPYLVGYYSWVGSL